jgi:chaperonin GroEL (HSP60 family)
MQKPKTKLVPLERGKWLNTTSRSSKWLKLFPMSKPSTKALRVLQIPKILLLNRKFRKSQNIFPLVDNWTHQAQMRIETETSLEKMKKHKGKEKNEENSRSFRSIPVRV